MRTAGAPGTDQHTPPIDTVDALPRTAVGPRAVARFALTGSRTRLALTLACTVIAFLTQLVSLVAALAAVTDPGHAVRWLLISGSALVLTMLAGLGADLLSRAVQDRIEAKIESALWLRMVQLRPAVLLGTPLRRLLGYAGAVSLVRSLLGTLGIDAVLGAIATALCTTALFTLDPVVGLVGTIATITIGAIALDSARRQQRQDRTVLDAVDEIQALLQPAIGGYDELAGYRAQGLVRRRWAAVFDRQKEADTRGLRIAAGGEALLGAAGPVLLALLPAVVLLRTAADGPSATAVSVTVVILVANQLAAGLGRLAGSLPGLFAIGLAHHRLRPVLQSVPESTSGRRIALAGRITLRGISFRYPGTDEPVLDRISIDVPPGSCVAVVGASGSGKSTILRLVLGLHEADEGVVLFDGIPAAELDPDTVRRQIGYVGQGGGLLRGTVRTLISGAADEEGPSDASADAAIWAAADAAAVGDELRGLPMALDTRITGSSGAFSGGQIQRLLLARALFRRPRVLLLDEATSALDEDGQQQVVDAVEDLHITRIVVAHRLSTIRTADQVIVLQDGRITDRGTYDELITRPSGLLRLVAQHTDPTAQQSHQPQE